MQMKWYMVPCHSLKSYYTCLFNFFYRIKNATLEARRRTVGCIYVVCCTASEFGVNLQANKHQIESL